MMKIKIEGLTKSQVNDIILLVQKEKGKVYAHREKGKLLLDFGSISFWQKRGIRKKIQRICLGKTPQE